MKKFLLYFLLLALFSPLVMAKTYHWKKGTTFLSFLHKNGIPQKLYYNLDAHDKELMAEIKAKQKYSMLKNRKGQIEEILIPITQELQIQIIKIKNKKKKYRISLRPIPFETLKGSIHLKIKKSFYKDLYAKTHSKALVTAVKKAYGNKVGLNKMKKGDSISIFYEQKRRAGKAISRPKILASSAIINKKKFYTYLTSNGRYYDSLGYEYRKYKKLYTPYIRPVKMKRVSSSFTHRRWHPILHRYRAHLGIDYAARTGTPIKATSKGKIIQRGRRGGYGHCITIQHANGMRSLYAHMSRYRKGLRVGSRVAQGEVIGYVGSTGRSTGPHLHFGMYKRGKAVNPARFVRVKQSKRASKLKGKKYRELRKTVVKYRSKFKKIRRSGGDPLFVKKGNYLVKRSEYIAMK